MSTSANGPDLIGLAGTFVGGKDTLAHRLEIDFGFTHVSTGDMVREVAMAERGSTERPVLQEVATNYREKLGAGALVILALQKPRPLVVTGLRTLGEAKALKSAGGLLAYIDAPLEERYRRMRERSRDEEVKLTLDEFAAGEQKELYSGDSDADFNLLGIKAMADIDIFNENSLEGFISDAYQLLGLVQ